MRLGLGSGRFHAAGRETCRRIAGWTSNWRRALGARVRDRRVSGEQDLKSDDSKVAATHTIVTKIAFSYGN
jgi:hypothetical protein